MAPGIAIVRRRHLVDVLGRAVAAVCAIGAAAILLLIMGYIIREGIGALSLSFLTQLPRPVGISGGGVANGIVGTMVIVGIAALMAFPVGILVGIYLAANSYNRIAQTLSFLADVLAGVPSIAVGIFAYSLLVEPFHHFSAFSASFAFAVLMLPLVIRATESAMRLVPPELREAATALGATDFHVTTRCLLLAARPGIVTGLLLALARVTGETAPLLFTAFGSQFWVLNPNRPMAELSLQIFTYAISPYKDWHQQAWGGALLLVLAVFVLSVMARLLFWKQHRVGG
ncbi:MAG TPA: phosphate ABC transporter permease PstA [Stellaceae bacterium]|nr:phosphate ABC transporter permease PstA [Stellaceae bacterium]